MQTKVINAGQYYLCYVTATKQMYVSPTLTSTQITINYPATCDAQAFDTLAEANAYVAQNGLTPINEN